MRLQGPEFELTREQIDAIATALTPVVAQKLLSTPTHWGDPSRVKIGRGVHLVNTLFNVASGDVFIGDNAFFGHNVCVLTGTHSISVFGLDRQGAVPSSGRDIHIGDGAWISSNATIIGPCRIGKNAAVGVGSVVIGDIPEGWFYAGCPAKPIKPVASRYRSSRTPGRRALSLVPNTIRRAVIRVLRLRPHVS